MNTRLFVRIWKRAFVYFELSILTVLVVACQVTFPSGAPPATPLPEVSIPNFLTLTEDDLPEVLRGKWGIRGLYSQIEAWRWTGAQGQLSRIYQGDRVTVSQNILQFATDEQAEKFWQRMKNDRIERALTEFDVVPLLSLEGLPPLHANNVLLRCESYWGGKLSICEARLQYGSAYTSVKLEITPPAMISLESLYDIVANVDKRMQPVWSQ